MNRSLGEPKWRCGSFKENIMKRTEDRIINRYAEIRTSSNVFKIQGAKKLLKCRIFNLIFVVSLESLCT